MVPLRTVLNNGDVVEITTQTGHQPSKDWLALVKTTRARNKIRQVINASERERAIDIGQKALEKEARRMGVSLAKLPTGEFDQLIADYGFSKRDDLEATVGYGRVSARQVLSRFAANPPAAPADTTPTAPRVGPFDKNDNSDLVLRVSGIDDMLIYRAKCCNPIRGESVVGYITRGKGVAVHSIHCTNVTSLLYEIDRKIDVEWARLSADKDKATGDTFQVKMQVYSEDRPGVLNQITSVLTSESSNIRSLEARPDEKRGADSAIIEMTIEVRDKKQLDRVISGIRRIAGVRDVERSS
jgi:GTP diphosphokinase / guanosine-3',5'-bis(diphosphate) 3'-diphosphatase